MFQPFVLHAPDGKRILLAPAFTVKETTQGVMVGDQEAVESFDEVADAANAQPSIIDGPVLEQRLKDFVPAVSDLVEIFNGLEEPAPPTKLLVDVDDTVPKFTKAVQNFARQLEVKFKGKKVILVNNGQQKTVDLTDVWGRSDQ